MSVGSFAFIASGPHMRGPQPKTLMYGYYECLERRHGKEKMFPLHLWQFKDLLQCNSEIIGFVINSDNEVVSTAQATLMRTPPIHQVCISNVVTLESFEDRGLGRMVMEGLEMQCKIRWRSPIKFFLRNSPDMDNAGFYQNLGWRPRDHTSPDPTVVWAKDG